MKKSPVVPILLATLWISIHEFLRNQLLLKDAWVSHYADMGLTFPAAPVNGAIWGVWSLALASIIYILSKKHSLIETCILAWINGFLLMWIVIGNLSVLPFSILPYAIPWSALEVYGAARIAFAWKHRKA